MTTRRRFLGLLAAGAAAIGLPGICGAATAPARRGVPGATYFRVVDYPTPDGYRVYFNGRDVHCEVDEADTAAGWVRFVKVQPGDEWEHWERRDGRLVRTDRPPRVVRWYAFGRVELRRESALEAKTMFCDPGGWVTVRVPVDTKA